MGKSSIDQNGFRRQTANPVSMVGVFPYTGEQIDYDGSMGLEPKRVYWVFRPPEELFHPEALESFNGIPIRIGHVMLGENFKAVDDEPADGCIYNARQSLDMPEYLIAEFCIYTDKMKDVLSKGKVKELSLGYRCQYVPCNGSYKGKAYDFKQVNLRGNHLALVEHGRCGSSVCVCDKALITFDSLPKELENMEKPAEDKKQIEKVQRLAQAVKNGDEQACQDCLDFYDLTPEQRKEALAYIKGKKKEEEPKTPAEDSKAKDGELPPPPPPPPEEPPAKPEEEEKSAPTEETPPAEEKPAHVEPPPAKEEPPAEAPATDGCKKCKKATKDEGVTEPSIPTPKQNLEGAVTPKTEEKEDAPANDGGTKDAKKDCEGGTKDCGTKDEKPADDKKSEEKKDECKDGKCDKPITEDAKKKCPKCGKDEDDCDCKEEAEETVVVEGGAADENPDAKPTKALKPETDVPSKMGGEEGEQDIKADEKQKGAISQDEYKAFAAEYAKAQSLAEKVRPYIKETFDSALMREVDVARFAAQHIPGLAFAIDAADGEVLSAVRGMVAHIEQSKKAPVVFGMDESLNKKTEVAPAMPTNTAQKLTDFLTA